MSNAEPDIHDLHARVRKAAHDVRTPLTSIAGFAQLLVEDKSLNPDARENSAIILEESKRLSEMLESFFDAISKELDEQGADTR